MRHAQKPGKPVVIWRGRDPEPQDFKGDARRNRRPPWSLVQLRSFSLEVRCVMTPDLALSAIGAILLIAAFVSVPLDDVIEPILARFR